MARVKKLSKFEHGYLCAVSNLIAGHGCNTDAWDTFRGLGRSLKEVLSLPDLDDFDRGNLKELISFDDDYTEDERNDRP